MRGRRRSYRSTYLRRHPWRFRGRRRERSEPGACLGIVGIKRENSFQTEPDLLRIVHTSGEPLPGFLVGGIIPGDTSQQGPRSGAVPRFPGGNGFAENGSCAHRPPIPATRRRTPVVDSAPRSPTPSHYRRGSSRPAGKVRRRLMRRQGSLISGEADPAGTGPGPAEPNAVGVLVTIPHRPAGRGPRGRWLPRS
jgi:hypothetical protein